MKTSFKVFLVGIALVSLAYSQEPTQALTKQLSSGETRKGVVVSGAPQPAAPVLQPKALPAMNPPLGEIARLARAAHAAAPKALVVVETDTASQKEEQKEEQKEDQKEDQKAAEDQLQTSSAPTDRETFIQAASPRH
jgi:hypothetical protein